MVIISRRGLTLIELLISIGLIGILVSAVSLIGLSVFRSWPAESSHTDARVTASNTAERILKELRSTSEISVAGANQITFWNDSNSNGLKEAPGEDVTFSWSGLSGESLYRSRGLGPNQESIKNINNFSITYFDENNQTLSQPVTLSLIRALEFDIQSQIDEELIELRFNLKTRNL